MKIESAEPGAWWVEMRGPDELSGADRRTLESFEDRATGLDKGIWSGDDGDWEVSADGAAMIRRPARLKISRKHLTEQRDAMLARLITAWSFPLALPYQPGHLDTDDMPLPATEKIIDIYGDVLERIREGGPKETPEPSGTSSSTSKDESTSPQPDSAPPTAEPASGSPATGA